MSEAVERTVKSVREKYDPEFAYIYNEWSPWQRLAHPLREAKVALLTTGGVYLKRWQEPFADQDPHGDGGFREVPANVESEDLAIAHGHYDHKYADRDINVVFPLDRLRQLERDAFIGSVAPLHYTLMGYNTRPYKLLADSALQMAWRLKMANVDAAVLVVV